MSPEERQLLTALFDRVKTATATPRDREAEGLITEAVRAEPAAPYYLAQAVIVQEKGLEAAAARIEDLERRLQRAESGGAGEAREQGGFLSSIFGSREATRRDPAPASQAAPSAGYAQRPVAPQASGPWGRAPDAGYGAPAPGYGYGGGAPAFSGGTGRGGGFLTGAMTTAAGVAGGMLLANSLSGLFANHMTGLGLGNALPAEFPVEETVINNYYGDDAVTAADTDAGPQDDGGIQQANDDFGGNDDGGFDQDDGGDDSGSMDV